MDQITIAQNANVNRKIITLAESLLHQLSPSAIWLVLKKIRAIWITQSEEKRIFLVKHLNTSNFRQNSLQQREI